MDETSSVSSFRNSSIRYDEGKINALYDNLKSDFEEIKKSMKLVQNDLQSVQKDVLLTVKLLRKVFSNKENSNPSTN